MITLEQWREFAEAVERHVQDYTVPQYGDWPDDQMTGFSEADMLQNIRRYENRRGKSARGKGDELLDCLKIAHYWQTLCSGQGPRVRKWKEYAALIADYIKDKNDRILSTMTPVLRACEHWHKLKKEETTMTLTMPSIQLKIRKSHPEAIMPEYKSEGAAGFDLAACEDVEIGPYERKVVPTGLQMEIPVGFELSIRPRSGLALKGRLLMPNAPGTIDSDYRGDVGIIFLNQSPHALTVEAGSRVAQAVLSPVWRGILEEVEELSETGRGAGGFGSTGV